VTLDAALDELYGVSPGEFVATRTALAKQLRADGDAAAAKELGAARRPTTAAWALNRLARERPDLVDDLIERSTALRAAQSRATTGTADELRHASADRRAALNGATDAAVDLAAAVATNPDAHRDAIAATLEAASVDETLGTALRHGRLVREAAGAVGFPEFAPLKVVPGGRPPAAPAKGSGTGAAKGKAAPAAEGAAPSAAEERAERAREAMAAAEEKARTARQRESELAVVAGEAEQRLEDRQHELEAAHEAVQAAKADVRAAHGELQKARRVVTAAERTLEKARAAASR
jgi:hypothetical protein